MSEARLKRKTIKLSIMLVGMCIGLWKAPTLIEKFTGGGGPESLLLQHLPGGATAHLSAPKQGGLNAEGMPPPPDTGGATPGKRAKGEVTATKSNTRSRSSSSSSGARVVRGGS
ncbi:MAG: hypothetical protein KAS72_14815 [Phycisphaerales bacterium]|nr:hypothetical protein [Phycisphaerales bacterium]